MKTRQRELELARLRDQVVRDPYDLEPRRAYSDILRRLGLEEQADFIDRQLAHPREWFTLPPWPATPGRTHWLPLDTRLYSRARRWSAVPDCVTAPAWNSGFLGMIHIRLVDFLAQAGKLFQRQPILRVYLSDRWPLPCLARVQAESRDWRCEDSRWDGEHVLPSLLPAELFRQLRSGRPGMYAHVQRTYVSADEALFDLSQVLVEHGRKLAGLPALSAIE